MDKAEIIKLTVEAVREHDAKQRIKDIESRYDWRLRNTRLLLKHYNYFQKHIKDAVYCSDQLGTVDLLGEMEGYSATVNIQSIKKSVQKTFVIMKHIDAMLDLYESYAYRKGQAEQRKLRVLKGFYLHGRRMMDIAEEEYVTERTCSRDLCDAINTLSALIFGIDSVNEMIE